MSKFRGGKTVLRGGRLIDPARELDQVADLWIDHGQIIGTGNPPADADQFKVADVSDCWISPGLCDLSARVLSNSAAELKAAMAGGITRVVCPPNAQFSLDTPSQIRDRQNHLKVEPSENPQVFMLGALTRGQLGEQLTDQASLTAAGCIGLSDGGRALADTRVLRSALQYAASLNITTFLQAQDVDLSDGYAHDGAIATRLGLATIPSAAETTEMARILALVEDTGARVHLTRISSAAGVRILERAKSDGLPVTADVAIHQLFLTEHDLVGFDARCHVQPPLRSTGDREALINAVSEGVIDAICSDHTPLSADAKLAPFADTEPGISGLETLLGLGLRLVEDGKLSMNQLIARLTSGPATLLGLEDQGICQGASTNNLILFDPSQMWRPCGPHWQSTGRNTPLTQWEFHGRPERLLGC